MPVADEDGNGDKHTVDARILLMSRPGEGSKGVLVWQAGGLRYGQEIKGIPVDRALLVRACEISGDGSDRAKYAFKLKELKEAAAR